jgi:hypothetical protein
VTERQIRAGRDISGIASAGDLAINVQYQSGPVSAPVAKDCRPGADAGDQGHAFICYVREDSLLADRLQGDLEAAGIPVWRDSANLWPGEDWRQKIRRAITNDAIIFLACFLSSSTARHKSYQNEELMLAVEDLRRRPADVPWLIPVRFDDCPVPDLDIGGGRSLGYIQRADLFGDRRDNEFSRLISTIRQLLRG